MRKITMIAMVGLLVVGLITGVGYAADKQIFGTVIVTSVAGSGAGLTSIPASGVSGTAVVDNDARLSDARTPTAHNQAWSTIESTPTTISGYGVTDAVNTNDSRLTDARTPVAHDQAFSTITSTPTTTAGYGITDAVADTDIRLTVGGHLLITWAGPTSSVYVVSVDGLTTNKLGAFYSE